MAQLFTSVNRNFNVRPIWKLYTHIYIHIVHRSIYSVVIVVVSYLGTLIIYIHSLSISLAHINDKNNFLPNHRFLPSRQKNSPFLLCPPPHSFFYSHRVNHGTNTFHILAEYFTSYLFSRRCFRCFYFLYFSSSRSNKAIFCYLLFFFACCFEIFNEIHVWFFIFCFRSPFFLVSSRCTSIPTKLFVKIKHVHTYHAH